MGFKDRLEKIALGDPDQRFLRGMFPNAADIYEHAGWTVADISADQVVGFTGHDEVSFVQDDGSGAQTWQYQGRPITVRQDPDLEYRAYLPPQND